MARYLLDTNICVFLFRNKFGIREKLQEVGLENCAVSVLPIEPAIPFASKEKARLKIAGTEVCDLIDLLIAGTAFANNLVLVTDNVRHFQKVRGISVEN